MRTNRFLRVPARLAAGVFLAALAVLGATSSGAAPLRYHATPLSTLGSVATGLNVHAQVVLYTDEAPDGTGVWQAGVVTPVPRGSGGRPSNKGQVGAFLDEPPFGTHPALFDVATGTLTSLTTQWLSLNPYVLDVNNAGVAVGYRNEAPEQAKVYVGGEAVDLGPGLVRAINGNGVSAGYLYFYDENTGQTRQRGFLASPDLATITEIAALPGGTYGEAADIEEDQVTGTGDVDGGNGMRAFRFDLRRQRLTALDTLGGAYAGGLGVNRQGMVVGWSTLPGDVDFRAVVWRGKAAPIDLNEASDLPAGWTLVEAVDINRSGQIVANAVDANGQAQAFLLEPLRGRASPQPQADPVARPPTSFERLCVQARPWERLRPRPSVNGRPLPPAPPLAPCVARGATQRR